MSGSNYKMPWADEAEDDGLLHGEQCPEHHIEMSLSGECFACESERKL